ncbi:MAG TPA: cyclase family protein [Candidatus Methanoculleus thermohydrogenotrophicum]|nr:cyclase family protein [Candidatus Methanoculleus thermohydrogenotrophicum]NLM81992.1 cyclase family protein [Candidatus Methanoculleus thermohydrogenotrophicum]HOB18456.1 cyclase family protein [Candidatus Methanoculleus thermohydrogenotrophicum]HPZ38558.1 cyclase family protein [Candidatus Methanoculleus thermohydrogenotrophicum]HQC91675.1 cyclase family protein [Candidatus Methanoculleus thermohydrogenotrophicum]
MKVYDITHDLSEEVVFYPGDIRPRFREVDTGQYRVTEMTLGSHSGTHIDAPSHYLEGGQTVDQIPPTVLIGPAQVLDCTDAAEVIRPGHLAGRLPGTRTLLLKTRFSGRQKFEPDYPALSIEAAELITETEITCLGTDAPSIEAFEGDGSVHRRLLGRGIVILELLDLAAVPGGEYFMIALPLRLKGADGSPVRAILCKQGAEEKP